MSAPAAVTAGATDHNDAQRHRITNFLEYARQPCHIATLTALSLPGESSVTVATPPSLVTSTRPAMVPHSSFAPDVS